MFKKPTKKQLLIRRIIVSAIATLSVIVILIVTIFFMLGYRLDSGNGRLEQGALMQFDSQPGGASVAIDNKNVGTTATKQTVVAGVHTVTMNKSGYEQWTRTLDLQAGTLTWLDYVRLVPTNRSVQSVSTYSSLVGVKISPDTKWMLAQENAAVATFQLVDLRSQDIKTTTISLPATAVSEAATPDVTHTFSIVSWDSGSRYVIIKHLYKDQTEWLVLDTQNPTATVNVSQVLGVSLTDIRFASTNGKVLYGLTTDGTLRKIDLSAETLSRAFVSHVNEFSLFDNTIVSYVGTDTTDANKQVVGVYRDGDESPHVLRTVTSTEANPAVLKIATGRYFNDDYVAIAEGNMITVLKGHYPSSSSQDTTSLAVLESFELTGAVSNLSFSPSGDYVLAQSAGSFKSYEIEHDRIASGAISTNQGAPASSLKWLDQAHIWNDDADELVMRDFNGNNVYSIMKVVSGFDAGLSQNGRYFYGIGKSDSGYHLQRIKMILD